MAAAPLPFDHVDGECCIGLALLRSSESDHSYLSCCRGGGDSVFAAAMQDSHCCCEIASVSDDASDVADRTAELEAEEYLVAQLVYPDDQALGDVYEHRLFFAGDGSSAAGAAAAAAVPSSLQTTPTHNTPTVATTNAAAAKATTAAINDPQTLMVENAVKHLYLQECILEDVARRRIEQPPRRRRPTASPEPIIIESPSSNNSLPAPAEEENEESDDDDPWLPFAIRQKNREARLLLRRRDGDDDGAASVGLISNKVTETGSSSSSSSSWSAVVAPERQRYSHDPYNWDVFGIAAQRHQQLAAARFEPAAFLPTPPDDFAFSAATENEGGFYGSYLSEQSAAASSPLEEPPTAAPPHIMCCYHKQGKVCKMGAACWYSHEGDASTPCHYGAACKAGHGHLTRANPCAPVAGGAPKSQKNRGARVRFADLPPPASGSEVASLPAGHVGYQTVATASSPSEAAAAATHQVHQPPRGSKKRRAQQQQYAAAAYQDMEEDATAMQFTQPAQQQHFQEQQPYFPASAAATQPTPTPYGTYPSYPSPMPCAQCGATEGVMAQEFPIYQGRKKTIGVRGHCGQCMATFLIAS